MPAKRTSPKKKATRKKASGKKKPTRRAASGVVNTATLAKECNVTRQAIEKMRRELGMPFSMEGRQYRYDLAKCRRWMRENLSDVHGGKRSGVAGKGKTSKSPPRGAHTPNTVDADADPLDIETGESVTRVRADTQKKILESQVLSLTILERTGKLVPVEDVIAQLVDVFGATRDYMDKSRDARASRIIQATGLKVDTLDQVRRVLEAEDEQLLVMLRRADVWSDAHEEAA